MPSSGLFSAGWPQALAYVAVKNLGHKSQSFQKFDFLLSLHTLYYAIKGVDANKCPPLLSLLLRALSFESIEASGSVMKRKTKVN